MRSCGAPPAFSPRMTLRRVAKPVAPTAATAAVDSLRGKSPQARPSAAREGRAGKLAKLVTRLLERAEPLWDEYDRLEDELAMGDPANTAEVKGFLRRAEKNSSDCDILAHAAELAEEEAKVEREAELGGHRLKAKEELEKARGEKGKAPTIADIDAALASMFPDEVAKYATAKAESKALVSHLFHLSSLWKQRAKTLEAMLK